MLTPDIVYEVSTIPPVMIAMRRARYVVKEIQVAGPNFLNSLPYPPGLNPSWPQSDQTVFVLSR